MTTSRLQDEGEFGALTHGIDSFSADTHEVAKVPLERPRLGTAAGKRAFRGVPGFTAMERGGRLAAG